MINNFLFLFLVIISYLIGSIPFGFLLVKIFKGVDIRFIGSGNIGTTNVLRAGYPILAILTLILDISKGFVVAIISMHYLSANLGFIIGLAAVLGHLYPIYLNFKGGKGVATSLGLLLAINTYLFFISIFTWVFVAFIFRFSSLAAIVTFILVPLYAYFLKTNILIICSLIFLSIIILLKHKSNIKNLFLQKETKIKIKKTNHEKYTRTRIN